MSTSKAAFRRCGSSLSANMPPPHNTQCLGRLACSFNWNVGAFICCGSDVFVYICLEQTNHTHTHRPTFAMHSNLHAQTHIYDCGESVYVGYAYSSSRSGLSLASFSKHRLEECDVFVMCFSLIISHCCIAQTMPYSAFINRDNSTSSP